MNVFQRCFFPALTCMVVLGAAVLPAQVSRSLDARQFSQVYTEERDAASLPVRKALTLAERISLYAGRYSAGYPVLFSQDSAYFEDSEGQAATQAAQKQLIETGILPHWFFQEEPFDNVEITRLLLWDPEPGTTIQEPNFFWKITWSFYSNPLHQKSVYAVLDSETGLPVYLWINDTNMSQWLPYGTEDLQLLAEQFFEMLGLEVEEAEPGEGSHERERCLELRYCAAGTTLHFLVSRFPTACGIEPELEQRDDFNSVSLSEYTGE